MTEGNVNELKWKGKTGMGGRIHRNTQKIFDLTKQDNIFLFLSVFQKLKHSPVDLDHLIAYNYGYNKFKNGTQVLTDYTQWLNVIGNFSGIDAKANRVFQDKPPSFKFNNKASQKESYSNPEFIKVNAQLKDSDIEYCINIEKLLKKGKQEEAGDLLYRFVADRTLRIWNYIVKEMGYPKFLLKDNQVKGLPIDYDN